MSNVGAGISPIVLTKTPNCLRAYRPEYLQWFTNEGACLLADRPELSPTRLFKGSYCRKKWECSNEYFKFVINEVVILFWNILYISFFITIF